MSTDTREGQGDLHGLHFRLLPVAGGVRVTAAMGKNEPAVWVVPRVPRQ